MDFKDYYEILGVSPDADQKTIKQTYRKLARQYHPDVNPDNAEAEERFKEINEAYQALSDPEQRQKYDQLRAQYQRWQQSGGQPRDFNWQQYAAQPGENPNVRYASMEDLEDLFGGQSPYSDFFSSIFGQAAAGGAQPGAGRARAARPRRGRDLEHELDVTLEEAYHGSSRLLQIGDRRIEASIPAGVRSGSRIRLSGQGEPGVNGGSPGDLYLVIRVLPHPTFEREGDNLYTDISVDFYTAVTGGEVRVPTMGKDVLLRIPERTQADRSFRLRGKGMPQLGNSKQHGDLYARVKLVLPETLSDQEVEAIKALAEERETAGTPG